MVALERNSPTHQAQHPLQGLPSSISSPRILQIMSITRKKEVTCDVVVFVRAVHALCNVRVVRKHEYINDSLHAFLKIFGSTHERKATIEDQHVDTGICRERPDLDGWLCLIFNAPNASKCARNFSEKAGIHQVYLPIPNSIMDSQESVSAGDLDLCRESRRYTCGLPVWTCTRVQP